MENIGEIELDNCTTALPHCLVAIFKKIFAINVRISPVNSFLSLDLYFVLQRTMTLPWHSSVFTQCKRKKKHHSNQHLKFYQNVFLAFLYSGIQPMYGHLDYMKCDIL